MPTIREIRSSPAPSLLICCSMPSKTLISFPPPNSLSIAFLDSTHPFVTSICDFLKSLNFLSKSSRGDACGPPPPPPPTSSGSSKSAPTPAPILDCVTLRACAAAMSAAVAVGLPCSLLQFSSAPGVSSIVSKIVLNV